MADLLLADAVQQLEVVLIGYPAAQTVDLLSEGITQAQVLISTPPVQLHLRSFTAPPPAPLPLQCHWWESLLPAISQ